MILLKKSICILLLSFLIFSCAHSGAKGKTDGVAPKVEQEQSFWNRWFWGFNIFDFDFNMKLPVFSDIKLSFKEGDSYGIKLNYEYEQMNVDLKPSNLGSIGATPKSQQTYYLKIFDEEGPTLGFSSETGQARERRGRVEKLNFPFAVGVSTEYIIPEVDFGTGNTAFRGVPSLSFRGYFKYNFVRVSLISIPIVSDRIRNTRRKALGVKVSQADKSLFIGYEKMTGFREKGSGILNDNLASKQFRVDANYAFNESYSLKRFTSFKEEEIGGSAILKFSYRKSSFGDNEMIIPTSKRSYFFEDGNLVSVFTRSYSLQGGYGYAWNDQTGLLFMAKIFGGLSYHRNSLEVMGGLKRHNNSVNEIFDGEFRIGYAYGKWVFGTSFSFDYENKSVSENIELNTVRYKLGLFDFRYRFGVDDIADKHEN